MPWFKVDDTLAFHAKVVTAGNAAMGLWVRAGAWCAQQLTDGHVPNHMISVLGTTGQAKALVTAGLWTRVDGGYDFHEWSDRQPSREQVEREREAAADRQRRAREKARESRQQNDTETGTVTRESRRDTTVSHGPPDPTRPDPIVMSPSGDINPQPTDRPDIDAICAHLADRIHANGSKRPTITTAWREAARLMLDRDGRTPEQVHAAIDWCQDDEFWRSNILSLPKLRDQYDRLRLQAARTPRTTDPAADILRREMDAARAHDHDTHTPALQAAP